MEELKTILDFDIVQKLRNNYVITRRIDETDQVTPKYEYHVAKIHSDTQQIEILERIGSTGRNVVSIPESQIDLAKSVLLSYLPE
jgi:hypothetical protein